MSGGGGGGLGGSASERERLDLDASQPHARHHGEHERHSDMKTGLLSAAEPGAEQYSLPFERDTQAVASDQHMGGGSVKSPGRQRQQQILKSNQEILEKRQRTRARQNVCIPIDTLYTDIHSSLSLSLCLDVYASLCVLSRDVACITYIGAEVSQHVRGGDGGSWHVLHGHYRHLRALEDWYSIQHSLVSPCSTESSSFIYIPMYLLGVFPSHVSLSLSLFGSVIVLCDVITPPYHAQPCILC